MARKKKAEAPGNTEGWLTTYADLLSLLLCFFVMMYTASVPDDARMQWILQSLTTVSGNIVNPVAEDDDRIDGDSDEQPNLIGPDTVNLEGDLPGIAGDLPMAFDDLFNWVSEIIDADDLQDSVSVEMYQDRMHIRFDSDVMFAPESAVIRPQGQDTLLRFASGIRAINPFIATAEVQGHTAPAPPGVNPRYWGVANPWQLSSDRASVVTQLLDHQNVQMVDSHKFLSTGHGPHNPHYDTSGDSNNRNRRVELILTRSEYRPEDTPAMLDMLMYDYLFPLMPGGPLEGRQPCPDTIDAHQQILLSILNMNNVGEEIFEAPEPSPTDGRGFDFSIPTLP